MRPLTNEMIDFLRGIGRLRLAKWHVRTQSLVYSSYTPDLYSQMQTDFSEEPWRDYDGRGRSPSPGRVLRIPQNSRIHRDDAGAIKICFFTGIRFFEAVRVTPKQNKGFGNKWKRKKCAYRGIETTILRNKLILGTRFNMARGTLFGGTDHANQTIDVVVRILKTYRDNEKELQMIHEDWHDTTENNGRVSAARTAGALHRAK